MSRNCKYWKWVDNDPKGYGVAGAGCRLHDGFCDGECDDFEELDISFDGYQEYAWALAQYPNKGHNLSYPALGVGGEAGEVCDCVKKIMRDDGEKVTPEKREQLKKELGDVMWYVAAVASELGLKLRDVAETNIEKLRDRRERGVLGGSGDNR